MPDDNAPPGPKTAIIDRLLRLRTRVDWMMVFPVAAAIAWAAGGSAMAMVLIVVLPICILLRGRDTGLPPPPDIAIDLSARRPMPRLPLQAFVDDVLRDCARRNRTTAVLLLQIDDLHVADSNWRSETAETVMDRVRQRITTTMRGQDAIIRSGDTCLTLVLAPTRRADLDAVMTIVDRVQAALAAPISIDGRSIRVRSNVGICSEAMAPARTGAALLAAADCALRVALQQSEDSVRSFSPDLQNQVETDHKLSLQIDDALDSGQITAWFQPQINTATGQIEGFEALARWHHPELGLLLPSHFLPALHAAGRIADLGEIMLRRSLEALIAWEQAGLMVPSVGVNLSLEELSDPRLADRLIWQVDRYDLSYGRIVIEILETVTLRENDETVIRNIRQLRGAGFRLDLDDFGTGAASISHIARFGVHRVKLDRSFLRDIDIDPAQRRIVLAILRLTESLGIDMLVEGVETPQERAILTDMGCPHIQGFGIARPMPFDETLTWAATHPPSGVTALHGLQTRGTA